MKARKMAESGRRLKEELRRKKGDTKDREKKEEWSDWEKRHRN
jgi:hypothetical protein